LADQPTTYALDPGLPFSRVVKLGCGYPVNIIYDAGPNANQVLLMEPKTDEPTLVEVRVPQRHSAHKGSAFAAALIDTSINHRGESAGE